MRCTILKRDIHMLYAGTRRYLRAVGRPGRVGRHYPWEHGRSAQIYCEINPRLTLSGTEPYKSTAKSTHGSRCPVLSCAVL
eukprot:2526109-Rhodomonas_salina.1